MSEFFFVRHGSTQNLELQQWQGWSAVPLSALGRRQATTVAGRLAATVTIQRLFSSPIARARETAAIISSATDVEVEELDALKERMTATRLWGVAHADSLDYALQAHNHRFDPGWRYEDEESWPELAARVVEVTSLLNNLHSSQTDGGTTGGPFVLVTHGITLRLIAAAILAGVESPLADWLRVADHLEPLECCSITRFDAGPHSNRLAAWNDIGHLSAVDDLGAPARTW